MSLIIFDAFLPYFGGKRKLCPVIFSYISKYLPREEWQNNIFVDAFLGSGAVRLFAKAQGFKIIANDIAERSYIAGQFLGMTRLNLFITTGVVLWISIPLKKTFDNVK